MTLVFLQLVNLPLVVSTSHSWCVTEGNYKMAKGYPPSKHGFSNELVKNETWSMVKTYQNRNICK
jgi:hypothetical protein